MAQTTTTHPGDTFPGQSSTVKDMGPVLPLGYQDSQGNLHKDFSVRPWRMKEERELGALRDNNKDATLFQYVGMVLATMLSRLGPHDFSQEGLDFNQKRLLVGQLTTGDVFYAYIWLRIQALGPELGVKFKCPACTTAVENFVADLNSVEVKAAEDMEQASWEYELLTPFQARGKEVKVMMVGPPRWNSLEMLQGSSGMGGAKPAVIRASIMGFGTRQEAEPIVITDRELDEMSKRDIETLIRQINDRTVGPNMTVEGKCPHCGHEFTMPIDWSYDNFFGDSSR